MISKAGWRHMVLVVDKVGEVMVSHFLLLLNDLGCGFGPGKEKLTVMVLFEFKSG